LSENVDRRILGAFVCIDAITGTSIVPPMRVTAPGWRVVPNRSGSYVIFDGPGLFKSPGEDDPTDQFIPESTWPVPVGFEVTLQDPNRRYLPRRVNVNAPLAVPTAPPAFTALSGVFAPIKVTMYPSPAAPIGPNWATIHASVVKSGATPPLGLPWAVLRVVRNSDSTVLATTQTDINGEALIAVIGLTVQANSEDGGPVTIATTAATITAYFDPSMLNQPSSWKPNPDDILNNLTNASLKSTSSAVQLGPGQESSLSFEIAV
jgi:hypothetical protein